MGGRRLSPPRIVLDQCALEKMMAKEPGPDPIDVVVGARLRIRRRWLGMSQTQLANALGITFQQVQKYEKGTNRVSASMLVRAAQTLKTTVAALVGEDGGDTVDAAIMQGLTVAGAQELLAAFAEITDADARRALSVLARDLSDRKEA